MEAMWRQEWNIYESEHTHMQETWNKNKNSSAQTKPLKIKKKKKAGKCNFTFPSNPSLRRAPILRARKAIWGVVGLE